MRFFTNASSGAPSERMRIDSSGNVGIGSTDPVADALATADDLVIKNASSAGLTIKSADSGNQTIAFGSSSDEDYALIQGYYNSGSPFVRHSISGSERMRLNSTGLGIGTTSPAQKLHVKTDTDGNGITIQRNSTTANTYGQLSFSATTNDAGTPNLWIRGYRGSSFTDNYMTFGTGSTTGTERIRLDSSGNLLHNCTSQVSGGQYSAHFTGGTKDGIALKNTNAGNTGSFLAFFNSSTALAGVISQTGATTVSYGTSSDARLKDVTGEARGLEVINELNPVDYNWKADGKADEGLIAQEVLDIVPNAVSGSEEDMYQMDYSKLVTPLIKAVQELSAEVNELKQQIQNLKGE
jgi:hypothetical protein